MCYSDSMSRKVENSYKGISLKILILIMKTLLDTITRNVGLEIAE